MNHELSTDAVLMQRVAAANLSDRTLQDNRDCLECLINRHARDLMTLVKRMIINHHLSEEIFQEVVLAVWFNRSQYEFPRPVKPWIFKIAVNRCRQEFRKRRRMITNQPEEVLVLKTDAYPDAVPIATESRKSIDLAIQRLPEQQREVVVLRIWNEMSYRDIAETVGVGESTVRSYMHHALKSLREALVSDDF